MNKAAAVTGALLLAAGLAVFGAKAFIYQVPLSPADVRGLWQVGLRITARGEGRHGSISTLLPSSVPGQTIFDERSTSGPLQFSIRVTDGARLGVWSGRFDGIHEVRYEFRVQSFGRRATLPERVVDKPPDEVTRAYGRSSPVYPMSAPQVEALCDELRLPSPPDVVGRVRTIFAFVTHEVASVRSAGDDAVLVLERREGSREGKERLLVTLLRAAGVPARNVRGLQLIEDAQPMERVWTEAWIGDGWVPMSAGSGFFGEQPASYIVLGTGDRPLVSGTEVRALAHRYHSAREHLRPEEIAAAMAPDNPALANLSLYTLPLSTQTSLRLLLVFPVGAFIVAILRNVVGVETFGTFLPVLIAFALRNFDIVTGLALVGTVLGVGVVGRLALERLRLLLVPRLAILLCLVIFTVTGFALVARTTEMRELLAGVLFPIVILTMLIERYSIALAEEGWRPATVRLGWSIAAVVVEYPVFRSVAVGHLMFSFPELVLCIMGLLVWIGGYTGYRLSDLLRFRLLARPEDATP
ncbi:MAG TPA: UUP1 family membrane protein [Candidatus Limnocylindria bacterium]|nr:UUP1 family membrane protein [Candidatus Limnocylindria bacterium]